MTADPVLRGEPLKNNFLILNRIEHTEWKTLYYRPSDIQKDFLIYLGITMNFRNDFINA